MRQFDQTGIEIHRMQPVLVDAEGEVWSVAPSIFWMRPRQPDCHIVDYAVSSLGFIHIWSVDGSTIVVSLRPNLVHPKTMVAAFYEIADLKPVRVYISTTNTTKQGWEVFNNLGRALDRIDQLVTAAWRSALGTRVSSIWRNIKSKDDGRQRYATTLQVA